MVKSYTIRNIEKKLLGDDVKASKIATTKRRKIKKTKIMKDEDVDVTLTLMLMFLQPKGGRNHKKLERPCSLGQSQKPLLLKNII